MPLFSLARVFTTLLSLAVLAAGGYLLWSWWDGRDVLTATGEILTVREDWRAWTAAALLAWSLLGRLIVVPLLGRAGGDPSRAARLDGERIESPTGSTLYVETLGDGTGPTIILTHGWGLDSTIWSYAKRDFLRRAFDQPCRLMVWDLPGLGRSRVGGQGVSLEAFSKDLAFLVERAGGPVVLVGHSIGGMTIQTLARDNPELVARSVAGIVLVNTTYTNPLKTMILSPLAQALRWPVLEPLFRLTVWLQPLMWLSAWQSYFSGSAHLANRIGFGRTVTRSQLDHVALLATRNPPGVQARGNLAMFRWDATGALARVACPVLVIGGDLDIVTKLEASEALAATTPVARLETVAGVNHLGFLEHADRYNDLIFGFAAANLDDERRRFQA